MIRWLLDRCRGRRILGQAALCALAITGGMAVDLEAQAGRSRVEEGNRLYEEGRFAEAYERYLEALRENPESPVIQFNQGNALYQGQEFQRALEAYRAAIESGDPALVSSAWYNLGNTLYQGQQLEASLEAYKQALRDDPADTDAKHNLERVLEQMQQQEEEDQNEDGESENNQDQGEQSPDQEEEEDPDDQQDEDEPQDPEQDPGDQEPPEQDEQDQGQSEPPPEGGMSREEAERLLQAIQEDPGDLNRQPPQAARGRIPRKRW